MLKSTGIVRKVDELGRVVIPIELRRNMGISEKDALEIYVDGEKIILKKYEPACIFCNSAEQVRYFKGKMICEHCAQEMQELILSEDAKNGLMKEGTSF
jgi:transcriptional pleiotropic regulator of transition state genes